MKTDMRAISARRPAPTSFWLVSSREEQNYQSVK